MFQLRILSSVYAWLNDYISFNFVISVFCFPSFCPHLATCQRERKLARLIAVPSAVFLRYKGQEYYHMFSSSSCYVETFILCSRKCPNESDRNPVEVTQFKTNKRKNPMKVSTCKSHADSVS